MECRRQKQKKNFWKNKIIQKTSGKGKIVVKFLLIFQAVIELL